MAESLESLVEKFKIKIEKLEEENLEREATLEAKHQQEMELLSEKEKVEREELEVKQKSDREELNTKQSQRVKDLTAKQHQEKETLKSDYGEKLKAIMENKMCANTSKKEVPECPVCLEPMNPPMRIFQCSSGHYICEDCNNNKEIRRCPTCRLKIVGRNIGMEQAIQLIVAPSDIPRQHQREVVQNHQKSGVGSQIADRGLTCDKCTLINKEGDKFCDACLAPLGIVHSPIIRSRKNRRGKSPAHSRHGQSSVRVGRDARGAALGMVHSPSRPDYSRNSMEYPSLMRGGRGRNRGRGMQSLTETTVSGQSSPVGVGRRVPLRVNADPFIPVYKFPPPVCTPPAMDATHANGFRMHVPTSRLVELRRLLDGLDVPPPRHQDVPPSSHQDVAPSRHQDVPPPRHQDVASPRHQDVPPSRHQDEAPPRHQDVPPPRHHDVAPSSHQDVAPPRHQDLVPPRHQDVAPSSHQDEAPSSHQDVVPTCHLEAKEQDFLREYRRYGRGHHGREETRDLALRNSTCFMESQFPQGKFGTDDEICQSNTNQMKADEICQSNTNQMKAGQTEQCHNGFNNHMHIPTGILVELETESPSGNSINFSDDE